ncbi:MAG: cysteine-rich small domain-containing protein, partial [Methanolinea sp.]
GDLPRDTLVVACEGDVVHADASPASVLGSRIAEAVRFGARTLREGGQRGGRGRPRFFIYSRYQGDHWAEWVPEECPYYPCHFPGQRCDFCYCPFYPCGDETLGQWVTSGTKNGPVWSCSDCTLLHEPAIADYLIAHPEASLRELKAKKTRERT